MLLRIFVMIAGLALCNPASTNSARILEKEILVAAPVARVWNAWTTADGLAFISQKSNVELQIGGAYEWFLDGEPDDNGRRGGEGSRVLAYLPEQMIAFTWTFPPDIPELRNTGEVTQVVVFFDEVSPGSTRVRLSAHEWQDGETWQRGWEYFDEAWSIVLEVLAQELSGSQ